MTRYYLHGDCRQTDDYYCQRCDLFGPAAHFDTCALGTVVKRGVRYRETHEWRFVTYRRRAVSARKAFDDARNLFRTGDVETQKLPRLERA